MAATLLVACGDNESDKPKKSYTVTFNADGGQPTPPSQTIQQGKTANEPQAPEKPEFVFSHWQTQDGTTYDFSQAVTSDLALKAVYVQPARLVLNTQDANTTTIIADNDPPIEYEVTLSDAQGNELTKQTFSGRELAMPPAFAKQHGFKDGDELRISVKAYKNSACVSDPNCTLKNYESKATNSDGSPNYDVPQDARLMILRNVATDTAIYRAAGGSVIDVPLRNFKATGLGFRIDYSAISKDIADVGEIFIATTGSGINSFSLECSYDATLFNGKPPLVPFGCFVVEKALNTNGGIMVFRRAPDDRYSHLRLGLSVSFKDGARYYAPPFDEIFNKYLGEDVVLDITTQGWKEGGYP